MSIWPKSARLLPWLNVPGALLLALLQRTPALRVAASAGEFVLASPLGAVLRPAVATAAALGALHTLVGATQFVVNRNPVTGTVGTPLSPSVAFTVTGATVPAGSYRITGQLPPGVSVIGASGGVLNASSGNIAGTPTASGTFSISILAYQFPGANGPATEQVGPITITFNITAAEPFFTVGTVLGGGGSTLVEVYEVP